MKLSVVMPLYNKAAFVLRAVQSVLAQTHQDLELIVVDDGSTDGSAQALAQLTDPRLTVLRQPNGGVAAARNRGIALANTDLVALLDADDWWAPDHLARLHGLVERFPQAVLYGAAFFFVDEQGRQRPVQLAPQHVKQADGYALIPDLVADVLAWQLPFNSSSVLVRRATLLAVGGFPLGVRLGEDLLTWMRMSCVGEVALSVHPTSFYDEPSLFQAQPLRPQLPDVVGPALAALAQAHPARAASLIRYKALWHRMRALMFLECGDSWQTMVDVMRAVKADKPTAKDLVCLALLPLPVAGRRAVLARIRQRRRAGGAA